MMRQQFVSSFACLINLLKALTLYNYFSLELQTITWLGFFPLKPTIVHRPVELFIYSSALKPPSRQRMHLQGESAGHKSLLRYLD